MATVQEAVRRLSIQATTSGVDSATTKLDELSDAQQNVAVTSQQTEKATLSLETRFASIERRYVAQVRAQQDYEKVQRQVNAAVSQNPALQERANAVLEAARQRMEKVTGAANDNAGAVGLARHELINLSRQAQDVGVSLAGGQNPFTVLIQQGSQIGDIFTSSQGSLRGFASQVASVVTPVRVLAVGLVAVGAGAVLAFASWKSFALALDDVSRQAGVASSSMAKLQAAASFKGIGQNDFVAGIQQFSAGVYEAQHGVGELATVLRANGKSATDFNQAMEAGADIIKNAASDQQRLVLLQQMGLPATMQWVRFMSDGAEGIRRAKQEATEFGGAANDNLVRRARQFDEAWNRAWTNFGLYARSAFQVAISAGATVLDRMDRIAKRMGNASVWQNFYTPESAAAAGVKLQSQFSGRFAGDGPNPAANDLVLQDALRQKATQLRGDGSVDKNALSATMGLEQQRIGILSQTATVADQVRSVELQVAQARLNLVRVTASEEEALKAVARENALGVTQMRAQIDALNVQTATIGMSAGAAAAFTAEQNRLNEAIRNRQVLTEQDKAAIREWAAEVGRATEAAARAAANDNISFGRQSALLSPDDVQIAQQLRGIYPDVATALGSVEAAGLRTNAALSTVSSSMSGTMVTALADVADGTKSVGQGAADMWKSFSRAIQEMIIKLYIVIPLMRSLQAASGMVGGFLGLGSSGVSAAQSMSATGFSTMTTGGLFHSGGLVGNPATSRSVDPSVFHGAPRYHSGGIAGLMPDEVPAILQRGERVLPRGQSAGGNVSITINGAPGTPKITQQDRPNGDRDIMIDFANAVKDVMVEDAATDGRASRAMQARAVGFGGR